MIAYRIADARHPIFDPAGAMRCGGRWNSPGGRVIYAAATYAGAMLEVLVHANLARPPKHHRAVRIEIPERVRVETVTAEDVPGWEAEDMAASRAFGDRWLREGRTAVLLAPSVVTRGREYNVVINAGHEDFGAIRAGRPEEVEWDGRLFGRAGGE